MTRTGPTASDVAEMTLTRGRTGPCCCGVPILPHLGAGGTLIPRLGHLASYMEEGPFSRLCFLVRRNLINPKYEVESGGRVLESSEGRAGGRAGLRAAAPSVYKATLLDDMVEATSTQNSHSRPPNSGTLTFIFPHINFSFGALSLSLLLLSETSKGDS